MSGVGLGRHAAPLVWIGAFLASAAVAAGNLALLGVALFPILVAVLSALAPRARVVAATFEVEPARAVVGQELRITVQLELAGRGPLQLAVDLPEPFRLMQEKNTLHTWVFGRSRQQLRFRAACDKRGVHTIGPITTQAPATWPLGAPSVQKVGTPFEVRVDPHAARLRRWPELRSGARSPLADMDLSPSGILTTQFQDIRPYVRGDPHRSINWKASARRGEREGHSNLMVNDYEREGRRQVWIFLDARPDLVGTNLDNALERRIEASLALASAYLRRGFAIGFTLFNQDPAGTPYPDSSGRQARRILELVTKLPKENVSEVRSLGDAVKSMRGHLHRARTVAFIVTTLRGGEVEDLRLLRRMLARRRGPVPVAIVHVDPSGLLPDARRNDLARTLAVLDRPHLDAVRALGIRAVRWDPSQQGLPALVRRMSA